MINEKQSIIHYTHSDNTSAGNTCVIQLANNNTNLQSRLEALAASDGQMVKINQWVHNITLWSQYPFMTTAAFILTAGTVSHGSMSENTDLQAHLDAQVSDDFSVEWIGNNVTSTLVCEYWDGSQAKHLWKTVFNVTFSKRIMALLNRTSQTERLQNLYLAIITYSSSNSAAINCYEKSMLRYKDVVKNIIIR